MGWVGLVYNMLWVGLGWVCTLVGWVGFQKVDPCPCLGITQLKLTTDGQQKSNLFISLWFSTNVEQFL